MKAGKHNSYFVVLRLANLELIIEYIYNKKMAKINALRLFVFDNPGRTVVGEVIISDSISQDSIDSHD
jgi:hypothetical protein